MDHHLQYLAMKCQDNVRQPSASTKPWTIMAYHGLPWTAHPLPIATAGFAPPITAVMRFTSRVGAMDAPLVAHRHGVQGTELAVAVAMVMIAQGCWIAWWDFSIWWFEVTGENQLTIHEPWILTIVNLEPPEGGWYYGDDLLPATGWYETPTIIGRELVSLTMIHQQQF